MAKPKLLLLPKYPRLGASSRLRTYQYIPFLKSEGYNMKVSSFFNEQYLKAVYGHRSVGKWNVLSCYFRRFWILLTAYRYDLVWIEKELFPYLPSYAEWLLSKFGKGYIVDYDDAVFHNYDRHNNRLVRLWMGRKIDWIMRHASCVMVGNPYLKQRADRAGAERVIMLPTVIDERRYTPKYGSKPNARTVIGWIGSPSTLKYLKQILPALEKLNEKHDFEFLMVNGTGKVNFSGNLRSIIWKESGEVWAIQQMDIGIMPLPDDLWERGKCAYKLIQYMACGLPVVASPVGMNVQVVTPGYNGYLADTQQEWIDTLTDLLLHPSKRHTMGQNGHALIHSQFTLSHNTQILRSILLDHI